MKCFGEGLSEVHKELNKIIRKQDSLEASKKLFLDLHKKLHLSNISEGEENEVDRLFSDLEAWEYAVMPTSKDETMAWVIWHIARIEDLTMGILVSGEDQLFNDEWKMRMNAPIIDTGNALDDDGIMKLSKRLQVDELINYRSAVGKRTRQIVASLQSGDMVRKVTSDAIEKIRLVGGVTMEEDSKWLLDFWGGKDVAGLLLMPPTRHVMLHLNDCCKWKEAIRAKKKLYLV
jgi:hypothetical protein